MNTVTSYTALITAIAGFLSALLGVTVLIRKVDAVHVLVNANLERVTTLLSAEQVRTSQLRSVIQGADIPIPPRVEDKP